MNQIFPPDRFDSVWKAIADTTEEAANLRLLSELVDKITALIDSKCWTQSGAASRCGVAQPRMNDLFRGRLSQFSLDVLVNIAAKLGPRALVELESA